ncbi:MAG: hypothetical protein OHK0023_02750 [Anaerolineae bacterium]
MANELILVVDDSRENRDFIVNYILVPNEYRALEARDGVEGMELIRRESPDLILLDLQMPRLDGMGVLEALRRENLNIPVILMTFHGSEELAIEVFRLGVRDYIKKPYTAEEMLHAIETNLSEVRLRQEKEALTARLLTANRELHNRIKELNTLYSIGKSVTALMELGQLFTRIVEAAVILTGAEGGSLMLLEETGLVLRAARRRGDAQAFTTEESLRDVAAERAISTGKPLMPTPQQLAQISGRGGRSLSAVLYVPMIIAGQAIGVLSVENVTPHARLFTDHDSALLSALSDYAAIAIENARRLRQIEYIGGQPTPIAAIPRPEKQRTQQLARVSDGGDVREIPAMRREVSVLFADLRGLVAFAEQAQTETVFELLNSYYAAVTETLLVRGATLDKFSGDGVFAYFNAPEDQADHTYLAVEAAFALQHAVQRLNAAQGAEVLSLGIGVTSGKCLIGSVRSANSTSFTAIGDPVTLARRLQEHARTGQILVDSTVIERIADRVQARRMGEVQMRGRRTPVTVYEIQDLL